MKKQVLFINGWVPKENFSDYNSFLSGVEFDLYAEKFFNWNKTLWEYLGEDYEYFKAPLREADYADYEAWKIMFEKMLPFIREDIIIVATSLWGSFILKYIGENEFPVRIKKLFLLAAATADTPDEKLWSFAFDLELVYNKVDRWSSQIYIYHSREDQLVPFEQSLELKTYFPDAIFREFTDKWHFYWEERIVELEQDIKN